MFWIWLWVIVSLFVGNNTSSNEFSSQVGEAMDLRKMAEDINVNIFQYYYFEPYKTGYKVAVA